MTATTRDGAEVPAAGQKPEKPTELHKQSWKYIGRKVLREFSEDQCTDQAAALTYYGVLALFPAILALVSILGLVGDPAKAVDTVLDTLRPLLSSDTLGTIEPVVQGLAQSQAAGFTLVVGLLGALWSASGYVGAFGRAMNRIYEIQEGRPFWKLRPLQLLITLVAIVSAALVLLMLVVSGDVAQAIGDQIGLGSTAVTVWNLAKWPVLFLFVLITVAVLYYATPNVKQPKFRWISVGAGVAIVVWVLVSIAFAFYVSNFGSYNKTYGSLAGVIVTLLWMWITNVALLFGAEIDSELERGRELQAGIPAEEELQLPARDTRGIKKAKEKEQADIERGRDIRERAEQEEAADEGSATARRSAGATTLSK
ncbi:MAG: Ribonuclease BN [uncultured Nocardioidaceae bacterium]|uniref:Ribonuclease BN n=1 Tax=uncultured Nocardioidaceae bacterium TaxID=253824 RepID=A0A6J4LHH9_9ACTN|nr:MAG: Ribonuclease BN [uncultured Nocardioidaceae bacterium]